MTPIRRLIPLLLLAGTLAGCATPQPVVYRSDAQTTTLKERADRDLATCRRAADEAVGLNGRDARTVARAAAQTGVIGFVAAAAGAAFAASTEVWQKARGGAAAGAAGAAAKTLLDWNAPDEVYQEYVERCMADRGHAVLGWR
jgi:outer membrane lipoprotein SlyB